MRKTYNTSCPRNCYSTCSFKVVVEENRIRSVEPQPLNRSTPEGTCLKGLSYVERAHSKDRVLYPLHKDENGRFTRISWEEAFALLHKKITYFQDNYGPQSIMFYAASGISGLLNGVSSAFWKKIGGATITYGNLCWPAGLEATRLTLGENKHNATWDLEQARLIVLWGKNPAESNIQEMIPIEKAIKNGAKMIVVDPRRTVSSDNADLLIQPKPGTDAALALAISKYLIDKKLIDTEFIDKYVLGFTEFAKSIEHATLKWASEICGVGEEFIVEMAELIGSIKPMTLIPGYGMQRYSNGGQTTRSLLAISVLTGNIGKPGACWHYANLQSDIFSDVLEPLNYYPENGPGEPMRRTVSMARLGEDMLAQKDPELKMIWVERGNPLTQNPDTNTILKAFRKLDFRVVVDQFLTDTAMEADLVLPAKNMFEQTDIIGSYWNPYVQIRQKVLEPAGEVKPENEIYLELLRRLGYKDEEIFKIMPMPDDTSIEAWLEKQLEPFPDLSLERLKKEPVIAPGHEEVVFADYTFKTPSGKIELLSKTAQEKWGVSELPTYDEPVEFQGNSDKYPVNLMSPNTKNRIHSQFGNLNVIKEMDNKPLAIISPVDAKTRNIHEGDRIRIFNDRGEVNVKVKFDIGIRPGSLVLSNGFWGQEGANPNFLSKGRETDMGHGTAFHDNMVEFEKAM